MENPESKILRLEQEGWAASVAHDPSYYQKYMDKECPVVTPFGTYTREMTISEMGSSTQAVSDYALIEPKIFMMREDLALITYKAMTETLKDGNKIKTFSWVTTIWEQHGGDWSFTFHQHIPLLSA